MRMRMTLIRFVDMFGISHAYSLQYAGYVSCETQPMLVQADSLLWQEVVKVVE